MISLNSPDKLFPSKGIEVGIQNILEELYVWKTFTLNLNMSSVVSSSSSSRPMSEAMLPRREMESLWSSLPGRCPYDDVISSSISIPSESVASSSLIPQCHRKSNFSSEGRGMLFPSIASVLGIQISKMDCKSSFSFYPLIFSAKQFPTQRFRPTLKISRNSNPNNPDVNSFIPSSNISKTIKYAIGYFKCTFQCI